jgi:hypothetical protein
LHIIGGARFAFYLKSLAIRSPLIFLYRQFFSYLDTADKGAPLWFVDFELQGGAANDVPMDATAFAHRDALVYFASYAIGIGRVSATTRNILSSLNEIITKSMPNKALGRYPGYVDPELPNSREAYLGLTCRD